MMLFVRDAVRGRGLCILIDMVLGRWCMGASEDDVSCITIRCDVCESRQRRSSGESNLLVRSLTRAKFLAQAYTLPSLN